ncbi:MAG TPA: HAMP domain-containing sensor histidine kinase, partial [Ignavibacteria bacterium]
IEQYIVNDIGVPPDTVKAKQICDDLGIRMRFESRDYVWSSDEKVPSIKEFAENVPEFRDKFMFPRPFVFRYQGKTYSIIARPGGIFIIEPLNIENMFSPERAIILMLIIITLMIIALYFILRRLFRPLKELSVAVKQIGEGNYNISLPVKRKDELGELASSINDMSKKIGYSLKAKEQLLIDVSHELRTPLTRIKLGLEVLSPKERINEDVIEMEKMISSLLESYRTGSFIDSVKLVRTNISELLEDTIEGFLDNQRIKFNKPAQDIFANADPEKLEIVFRNIIDNAMKYSNDIIEISMREQFGELLISFKDKGSGIKEEDLKYIFEPFYRADPSRSRKTGGFGLGLSISKKIMDAHNGEINIESKVNEGTTITLKLPIGDKVN